MARRPFRIVDTGGWMPGGTGAWLLTPRLPRAGESEVGDADVVLFVVDASVGVTDDDEAVADWLRHDTHDVRSFIVANKADNDHPGERELGDHGARARRAVPRGAALHGRQARGSARRGRRALSAGRRRRTRADNDGEGDRGADLARAPGARRHRVAPSSEGRTFRANRPSQPSRRSRPFRRPRHPRDDPRTRSTPWSRPTTVRSSSSTLPECAVDRVIDDFTAYYWLVHHLRAIDDADIRLLVIDATEVYLDDQTSALPRPASRRRGCPVVVMLDQVGAGGPDPDDQAVRLAELSRRLAFIGDAPSAEDLGARPVARACTACDRSCRRRSPSTTAGSRRGTSTGCWSMPSSARQPQAAPRCCSPCKGPATHRAFALFINRTLPRAVPALPGAGDSRDVRLGVDSDELHVRKRRLTGRRGTMPLV